MKLELTPEQEDAIYYGRMAEVIAAIKCGEIEIEAKEAARILEAFDLVRMI
jgi:hypothetical protein